MCKFTKYFFFDMWNFFCELTLLFILEKQMCQVLQTLYKKNWNTKQTLYVLLSKSIWKIVNSIFSTWCRKTQSLYWVQNKIKFHVKNMSIQDSKKLICRFFSPIDLLHISNSKSRKWLAFKTNGHWWQTVSKNTAMHFF